MRPYTLLLALVSLLFIAACGSDETPVGPADTEIRLALPSQTMNAGDTLVVTATNQAGAAVGVTWSLSPQIGTISESGRYTAPETIDRDSVVVTITATSKSSPGVTASVKITVRRIERSFRRPGVGSTFEMHEVFSRFDEQGNETTSSDEMRTVTVEEDGLLFGLKDSVMQLSRESNLTYLRYEADGDLLLPERNNGDQTQWIRLPYGSRTQASAVLAQETQSDGSMLLRSYTADWIGDSTVVIGGRRYATRRVKVVFTEVRSGGSAPATSRTEQDVLTFAPSIGWFTRMEAAISRDGRPELQGSYTLTSFTHR